MLWGDTEKYFVFRSILELNFRLRPAVLLYHYKINNLYCISATLPQAMRRVMINIQKNPSYCIRCRAESGSVKYFVSINYGKTRLQIQWIVPPTLPIVKSISWIDSLRVESLLKLTRGASWILIALQSRLNDLNRRPASALSAAFVCTAPYSSSSTSKSGRPESSTRLCETGNAGAGAHFLAIWCETRRNCCKEELSAAAAAIA